MTNRVTTHNSVRSLLMESTNSNRFGNIDALRGIAAMLVVWLHGSELFKAAIPSVTAPWLYKVAHGINAGQLGVVIFFAISGYVIYPSIAGERSEGTRQFLIRRFFRLYPAFWVSIPLAYIAIWLPKHQTIDIWSVLANVSMLPETLGDVAAMGQYWTLETEFVFYFLIVMLFNLSILRSRYTPAVAIALLVGTYLTIHAEAFSDVFSNLPRYQWREMPYNLAVMFWGALCRHVKETVPSADQRERRQMYALLVLGTGLTAAPGALTEITSQGWTTTAYANVTYLTAMAVFALPVAFWHRPPRVLTWFGQISYSLYLLHPVVAYPIYYWMRAHWRVLPEWQGVGFFFSIYIVGAIALAAVCYYLVERPAIRLGRVLSARRQPSPTREVASSGVGAGPHDVEQQAQSALP